MRTIQASKLFIFGFQGTHLSLEVLSFLAKTHAGGIILFKRNIEELAQVIALNSQIIECNTEYPPIISVDQEGGRVARLRGITTDVPPMKVIREAAEKNPDLPYRLGAMIGRELVTLGFNLNFAPVCDIAIAQADRDIIGDRAFSDNADEVANLSSLFIKGMQGAGIGASAKHFPGHGTTTIDTHFSLPTITLSQEIMHQRELKPFYAAIDADVATIMTAHILTTAFDASLPATLSTNIINNLLRTKMGYNGVVISDDLDMKAIADNYDLREILEYALMASVDMFIIGNNFDKAREAIIILQNLIDTNEHIAQKAAAAIQRIEKLRARYIGAPAVPDLSQAQNLLKSTPHLELIRACS